MTSLPPFVLPEPQSAEQKAKAAPYDERNAADYQKMSLRIAAALETIEHDETIPATQTSLTQLAGCSRGTLRNRGLPLDRLNLIKRKRAAKPASPLPKTATEIERFDRKRLYDELQDSRTEAATRFDEIQEAKSVIRKLRRTIKLLTEEKEGLKSQLENCLGSKPNNVSPFRPK